MTDAKIAPMLNLRDVMQCVHERSGLTLSSVSRRPAAYFEAEARKSHSASAPGLA